MLALHSSQNPKGAQFYIGCAQLKVTGSGSGSCGPTISIPGAYKADDDNVYIPKFYNGFDATTYKAPGGPVASCGAGTGSAPAPSKPSASPSMPANSTMPVASPVASASASASASPVQSSTPVASPVAVGTLVPSTAPSAAPSSAPSAVPSSTPSTGNGALPAEFTIETFISWLESKAAAASKARRHARSFL
jgi:cellulase